MGVKLLIDGRGVWVKSQVLGRWERPLRRKMGSKYGKGDGQNGVICGCCPQGFFFSFFKDSLPSVCVGCLGCSGSFSGLKPF